MGPPLLLFGVNGLCSDSSSTALELVRLSLFLGVNCVPSVEWLRLITLDELLLGCAVDDSCGGSISVSREGGTVFIRLLVDFEELLVFFGTDFGVVGLLLISASLLSMALVELDRLTFDALLLICVGDVSSVWVGDDEEERLGMVRFVLDPLFRGNGLSSVSPEEEDELGIAWPIVSFDILLLGVEGVLSLPLVSISREEGIVTLTFMFDLDPLLLRLE